MRFSANSLIGSFARASLVLTVAMGAAWAEESVTFEVPVQVQKLLDDVRVDVICVVRDKDDNWLGGDRVSLQPVEGSLDTTTTLVATPGAGKTFTVAVHWLCYLQLIKGEEYVQQIQEHEPTGGTDDWKYAKPGTTLVHQIFGTFDTN